MHRPLPALCIPKMQKGSGPARGGVEARLVNCITLGESAQHGYCTAVPVSRDGMLYELPLIKATH